MQVLLIFFLCAFRSGTDRYYLKKVTGESVKGKEVFFYFRPKNSLSLILFYINYWLRRMGVLLLCFLPFSLVTLFLFRYLQKNNASMTVSMILLFSAIALAVNGAYYFFRLNSFLFPARYCFASGRYDSFRQLFNSSYRCMEGNAGSVFRKKLSFTGWFLLCFTVFPAVFVRNYYMEEMAEFASDLIGI